MKALFDFLPIILFFITFKMWGIYVATAVAIGASALQVAYLWFSKQKIGTMVWVSLAAIVLFGSATIIFHNEVFIKWKPTIVYAIFAGILAVSQWGFRKNIVRTLLSENLALPEAVWHTLNWAWAGFFAVLALANIWVAYTFSTDTWVNFKLFGLLGLTLLFVLAQGFILARYIPRDEEDTNA